MSSLVWILFGAIFPLAAAWSLGRLLLRREQFPPVLSLAVGAPVLSLAVFILLAAGVLTKVTLAALGLACLVPLVWWRPAFRPPQSKLLVAALTPYLVLYAVHTLAPEIRADAMSVHLAHAAEQARLGHFPNRITFFEVLPQGLGMLYVVAISFGGPTAAKVVHFAFLLATVPLLLHLARRLGLPSHCGPVAAVLYFCAPVVGASGTSAYTDAAQVFVLLAAFYLLLEEHPFSAGLCVGFAYAIKITGLIGLAAFLWKRRPLFVAGAALIIAPWMTRAAILTGNPFAPLLNGLFANPYFYTSTEQKLSQNLRSSGAIYGVSPMAAPIEVTVRGAATHGLAGPLFLLAPLALFTLRRREVSLLLSVAAVLSVTWFLNLGTRFLMPALAFLSLALAATLPARAAVAVAALHAVLSWPAVLPLYAAPGAWALDGFPWRAALRIESEDTYLRSMLPEYNAAKMVEQHSDPRAQVFDVFGLPRIYIDRELTGPFQSARGVRLLEALSLAASPQRGVFSEAEAAWPPQSLRALRVWLRESGPSPWTIHEVRLLDGDETLAIHGAAELDAFPNIWEAPYALDRNLLTGWSTRQPRRAGMYFEVQFPAPMTLTGARFVAASAGQSSAIDVYGKDARGDWKLLAPVHPAQPMPGVNLRSAATRLLRREHIQYILTRADNEGIGTIGRSMKETLHEWNVEDVAHEGAVHLFRIKAE